MDHFQQDNKLSKTTIFLDLLLLKCINFKKKMSEHSTIDFILRKKTKYSGKHKGLENRKILINITTYLYTILPEDYNSTNNENKVNQY